MLQPPPAEPGMSIEEVDTPALLIDLDALESNLDHMAAFARQARVSLRPHAKTHKSPVIARMQIERGAVGQCVQKVAEAEVLAWGGVTDILVSNEVGTGLVPSTPEGRGFRDLCGSANQLVARYATTVEYLVAGLPLVLKGGG